MNSKSDDAPGGVIPIRFDTQIQRVSRGCHFFEVQRLILKEVLSPAKFVVEMLS